MTSNARVVVIGAGLAGARLARRLGELGRPALLVGEERHRPYNRVLLAEVLAGRYPPEVIGVPSGGAPTRARVIGIDRRTRTVRCADGTPIPYDTLVLATGSNPVLPPLRGLFTGAAPELPDGVHAFRTMDDCLGLSRTLRPGVRAVVIGGGLLGVSAARALAVRGARVVLVQQAERLMERHLDPGASALVRCHLTGLGVEVHTECRVRGVRVAAGADGGARTVEAVELADGYALDTDLVVLACGVQPRVGLAEDAGLAVRQGVLVDDALRTSDPRIHAIGDCARHDGTLYGLAAPALEQADTLARLLAGDGTARYMGTRALTRLTLTGEAPAPVPPFGPGPGLGAGPDLDLAAFGDPVPLPGDDVVQLTDATRGTYRKVVVRADRLVGGVLVGELGSVGALARAWEGTEPLPEEGPLLHLLTHGTHEGGPHD
ncbi:NAD(P)/FAD-dependent oxidoreductase [Streptomyces sp. NPDC088789]|uniref:NAD(P)/FAD-dependent oxidoreductase n=1 Tax=Streptomyces sp. NPDC088789 TaxID=3365899 RepID=UPI0037F32DE8